MGFINIHSVAKYPKPRRDPFETLKNFGKKVAQCQKNRRGDPLVSSGFVGYVKKVKNERGTLCTKFALAGFGLSGFSSFFKKWTDQCEVCGLKKKKVTVRVGQFSSKEKASAKRGDRSPDPYRPDNYGPCVKFSKESFESER